MPRGWEQEKGEKIPQQQSRAPDDSDPLDFSVYTLPRRMHSKTRLVPQPLDSRRHGYRTEGIAAAVAAPQRGSLAQHLMTKFTQWQVRFASWLFCLNFIGCVLLAAL